MKLSGRLSSPPKKAVITRRLKYPLFYSRRLILNGTGIIEEVPWSYMLKTNDVTRTSKPRRTVGNEVMSATANARCTKIAVGYLAKSTMGKRRSPVWATRPGTECISQEAVPRFSVVDNDEENEARVIQRASDGDPTAFECLYRSHCKRVYAVCLRMVGNTADAEDLTQEAFLLLFRKLHTFRGESAFSTWLHRLVVNTVLMHLRRKSLLAVSTEEGSAREGETAPSSVDIAASDLLLEGSIDRINLGRCIAQLPAGSRAVFVMHDIQGYQHHEIAELLGRSEGVSKSQLHRARKRLRELLHEIQREKYRLKREAAQKMLCLPR
jgi:RNA polymerase sigma-70 factor, ECF subfamily